MSQSRSTLELRLIGLVDANGEISLSLLGEVATLVHELALRTARSLVNAAGPGRTAAHVEEAASLTLTSVSTGSTVLELVAPERDATLPLGDEFADLSDRTLAAMGDAFEQLAGGVLPSGSPPVIDSLAGLIRAVGKRGAVLQLTTAVVDKLPRVARIEPADVDEVFTRSSSVIAQPDSPVVVSGDLYGVDLHSRRFRIEDDLGSTIAIIVADDVAEAGALVGHRVEAEGQAEVDSSGRVVRVLDAAVRVAGEIRGAEVGRFAAPMDLAGLLADVEPFDADQPGLADLDASEVDAFLAAIRS